MKTIIEKDGKQYLPDGREIEDTVHHDGEVLYRIDAAMYNIDGEFITGLSGNLNDPEDEPEVIPEHLKEMFYFSK